MIPTVAQQLRSIRHTIAMTVVPALDPTASFAQEQAGLILASLDWILDVQASEYRYEVVEHDDAHALAAALDALGADSGAPTSPADVDEAPLPDDLEALRARTLAAQQRAERRFLDLADSADAGAATALMTRAALRTTERELAAARMTGFPKDVPAGIADVLVRQTAEPFGQEAVAR